MFSGQLDPKTKSRNGFGKIIDLCGNYFFGMFQDDMPLNGYLLLSENLRLVKVDLRPYLESSKNLFFQGEEKSAKKSEKKQIKRNTTEDTTPKVSTEKLIFSAL